jgi:hypothetical protein
LHALPSLTFETLYFAHKCVTVFYAFLTGGADKSLARPTSQCILFDGENISFDTSLVIYIKGKIGTVTPKQAYVALRGPGG